MRGDTKVTAGWRNVGDSNSPPIIMRDAPISLVLKGLIQWIGANSIAKRFDIVIGYDEEYIVQKLNESRAAKKVALDEFDSDIAALMNRAPSDDPEDTWVPPAIK